jgi:hypothetical protein
MKKLARVLKNLRKKVDEWQKRFRQASADVKGWRKDNKQDRKERRNLQATVKRLRKELQQARQNDKDEVRIKPLQERIEDKVKRINFLNDRIKQRNKKLKDRIVRKRHIQKRLKFYVAKKTRVRKRWEQAKKDHEEGKGVKFETWMLNGCPNTLSDDEEEALALAVVGYDQTCTATSNGGHAVGSYHYYNPCRAFDAAGVYYKMIEAHRAMRAKYGTSFRELFGPDNWYIKNGSTYGGVFPGHSNHIHVARNF